MEHFLARPHFLGTQYLYRFKNGYGASVVPELDLDAPILANEFRAKEGEWEITRLWWTGLGDDDFTVVDGPWRHQSWEQIEIILETWCRGGLDAGDELG